MEKRAATAVEFYFAFAAGAGLANLDASIGAFGCTLASSTVDCPLVQVVVHLNGIFTPLTSR